MTKFESIEPTSDQRVILVGTIGFEPTTPTMSRWCSTTELRAYSKEFYSGHAHLWPILNAKSLRCADVHTSTLRLFINFAFNLVSQLNVSANPNLNPPKQLLLSFTLATLICGQS